MVDYRITVLETCHMSNLPKKAYYGCGDKVLKGTTWVEHELNPTVANCKEMKYFFKVEEEEKVLTGFEDLLL